MRWRGVMASEAVGDLVVASATWVDSVGLVVASARWADSETSAVVSRAQRWVVARGAIRGWFDRDLAEGRGAIRGGADPVGAGSVESATGADRGARGAILITDVSVISVTVDVIVSGRSGQDGDGRRRG